jgi:hypothetical protein
MSCKVEKLERLSDIQQRSAIALSRESTSMMSRRTAVVNQSVVGARKGKPRGGVITEVDEILESTNKLRIKKSSR